MNTENDTQSGQNKNPGGVVSGETNPSVPQNVGYVAGPTTPKGDGPNKAPIVKKSGSGSDSSFY